MRNKSLNPMLFIAAGILLFLYSCANIRSLDGGAKDVTPPKDSLYFPQNFSTNFSSSGFTIEFDEYINLNDINNQLIVSPPLTNKPTITVKKKKVMVSFEDTLLANTTYIFNFGKGIVDYTEGNPAKNLTYVFSTGDQLDSLSIAGSCYDALTNEPIEGVKVMLYEEDIDSLPLTQKPFYFGVTDQEGTFDIPYMKPGEYKVFCLEDDNGNYLYDEEEKMGFLDTVIQATMADSLQSKIRVLMSIAPPTMQAIMDYSSDSTGFLSLKFAKETKDLEYEILNLSEAEFTTEQVQDSTFFWITSSAESDKIFQLVVTEQEVLLDTLYLLYYPNQKKKIDWKPATKTAAIAVDSAFVLETFHTQLKTIDTTQFSLQADSIVVPFEAQITSTSNRKIAITGDWQPATTYDLEILPQGITSLHGVSNDTLRYKFKTNSLSSYGSIVVNLNTTDSLPKNYLLQLLNDKEELVHQQEITRNKVTIPQLQAKKYLLRIIADINNNKRWDSGNYIEKIQPEKSYLFPEIIQVKANWVLDYEWTIEPK